VRPRPAAAEPRPSVREPTRTERANAQGAVVEVDDVDADLGPVAIHRRADDVAAEAFPFLLLARVAPLVEEELEQERPLRARERLAHECA
jgi:hypothetical protein